MSTSTTPLPGTAAPAPADLDAPTSGQVEPSSTLGRPDDPESPKASSTAESGPAAASNSDNLDIADTISNAASAVPGPAAATTEESGRPAEAVAAEADNAAADTSSSNVGSPNPNFFSLYAAALGLVEPGSLGSRTTVTAAHDASQSSTPAPMTAKQQENLMLLLARATGQQGSTGGPARTKGHHARRRPATARHTSGDDSDDEIELERFMDRRRRQAAGENMIAPVALQTQLLRLITFLQTLNQILQEFLEIIPDMPHCGALATEILRCQFFIAQTIYAVEEFKASGWDRADPIRFEKAAESSCGYVFMCLNDVEIHLHNVTGAKETELSYSEAAMYELMADTMRTSDRPRTSGRASGRSVADRLAVLMINVIRPLALVSRAFGEMALSIDKPDQWISSHRRVKLAEMTALLDSIEENLPRLKAGLASFSKVAVPILLNKHKRRATGNAGITAAALLFAQTVAQVGNAQLFDAQDDSKSSVSLRFVQVLWTISLVSSIFASLLAAAAAYWNDAMWSKSRGVTSSKIRKNLYRLFFEWGPVGTVFISVATFFGGLCVSPYHLNFYDDIKIVTHVVSALCILLLILIIGITIRDDRVRAWGANVGYLRLQQTRA